uniref:KIB1-4 beta-propeller domain-containing protein n=1 Tax=Setaria viridis TaxID=4556 RepID=A0A4U6UNA0_SETVI|nr:hypothetical protein SEVIR_5G020100v2 [Setaria viridis]
MDASSEPFRLGQEESMLQLQLQDLQDFPPVHDWSQLPADLLIRIFVDLDVLNQFSSKLHLVNPLSRAQIALPPPLTIKNVRGCYTTDEVLDSYHLLKLDLVNHDCDAQAEPDDLTLEQGCFYFYLRVAMSADPSSGRCIVDARWTWIDVDQRCYSYNDFFYNDSNGLFYVVRGNGEVHTIDLNGPSPVVKIILRPMAPCIDNNKYIAQAPWGGMLQNLQEHVLFIGFNTPFFLLAEDYNMLTPDCIYLTNDYMDYIYSKKFGPRQVLVFNMKDGSLTDLFPDSDSDFWLSWPLPIWITPYYSQDNKG